jgi:hypothetical protein
LLLKVMCVSGESYDILTENGDWDMCYDNVSHVAANVVIDMSRLSNPGLLINVVGRGERASLEGVV